MRVKAPGFGFLEISGTRYEKDTVIMPDGDIKKRKKKLSKRFREEYGHTPLSELELEKLLEAKFDVLVIGNGYNSALPLTEKAKEMIDKLKKEKYVFIGDTKSAANFFNGSKARKLGIFHVTC